MTKFRAGLRQKGEERHGLRDLSVIVFYNLNRILIMKISEITNIVVVKQS